MKLENDLLPEEQILFHTRKHIIIFFTPFVWLVAAAVLWLVPNTLINKVALAPLTLALFTGFIQWLNYISSEFAVTTKRVIMREGFFFRHRNETRLATIANVSVDQSLLGQIFNYGTVSLHAFGGDKDPFMDMARPNDFQKHLQIQQDK